MTVTTRAANLADCGQSEEEAGRNRGLGSYVKQTVLLPSLHLTTTTPSGCSSGEEMHSKGWRPRW